MKYFYFFSILLIVFITACDSNNSGKSSRDGKIDKTVTIGGQTWMAENLNVDKFRNGDLIPEAKTNSEWKDASRNGTPAWCYYDYNPTYEEGYGKLYNWYAVNDPRGLAPEGWHVPSENDWKQLVQFLGYKYNTTYSAKTWAEIRAIEELTSVGPKLKAGKDWKKGKTNNSSGFSALPGGRNGNTGRCNYMKSQGHWWSSTEANPTGAIAFRLSASDSGFEMDADYKMNGKSVRCLKD
jgi:uncharacterized protein (TIGR02145 family)